MKSEIDPNELEIKSKPYKVGVGGSMYIHVMPNGSKYWRMAYRINEKQKTFAIGTYPDISFQEAEKIRDEVKLLVKRGIDPIDIKKKQEATEPVPEEIKPKIELKAEPRNFKLSVSGEDKFCIECNGKALSLNRKQAIAIQSFFDSALEAYQ